MLILAGVKLLFFTMSRMLWIRAEYNVHNIEMVLVLLSCLQRLKEFSAFCTAMLMKKLKVCRRLRGDKCGTGDLK